MLLLTLLACIELPNLIADDQEPACATRLVRYADADGDGVGSAAAVSIGCEAPEGYVEAAGDCDDADPSVTACDTADDGGDTGGAAR